MGMTRQIVPRANLAAGWGLSDHEDLGEAIPYAVNVAKEMIGDATPRLAIVGATSDREFEEAVDMIRGHIGTDVPIVGTTSCVSLLTPRGTVKNGISLMMLGGVEGAFATAGRPYGDDVEGAAAAAVADLRDRLGGPPSLVYIMSSPGPEETVLRCVADVFGDVPVFGGSAADNEMAGAWKVLEGGVGVMTNGVALFAVRKDSGIRVGAHVVSPYTATSTAARVTGAEGRTLVSLDGKRAADVLFAQVGEAVKTEYESGGVILGPMSSRPYALRRGDEEIAVHVEAINQPAGTVSLYAEAKVDDEFVVLENMTGGDSASAAGEAIRKSYHGALQVAGIEGTPSMALMIYCAGLSIAVGERLEWNLVGDLQRIEGLPEAIIGYNAFGEQGPVDGRVRHRNLSVGMLVMQ